MKKVLTALLLVTLLFTLCACSIPSDSFMSKSQVNSLVKKYGTPQAEVTLSYKTATGTAAQQVEVKVIYDLLLEQAPLAVTRFIQIANDGEYDGTVADINNADHNYIVLGRYKQFDKNKWYDMRSGGSTFAGEFKQNGYKEPKGGYPDFKMFSLAMYHVSDGEHFNSSDGTLILSLSSTDTLNSANYAVFAHLSKISVKIDEGEFKEYRNVPSFVHQNLSGFTVRSGARNVYDYHDDSKSAVSVNMLSTEITLTVKILGDYDWTKLPTIG